MQQAYKHLATYYDFLIPTSWYARLDRFVRLQIKRVHIKPLLIVDLACGTGRLTAKLQHIGPTIGIDNSSAMLRVARRNHPDVDFYKGSFTTFKLPRQQKADVIVCAFDSLNYLPTKRSLSKALSHCVSYLSPGGLLIFDMNGELAFVAKNKKGNQRVYRFKGDKLIWKNRFYGKVWEAEFEIQVKDAAGYFLTHFEKHIERYYSPQQIKKILKRSNIKILGIYSDVAMHRVFTKNKRYFFVVQKCA